MHASARTITVDRLHGDGPTTVHLVINGSYTWGEDWISTKQAERLYEQLARFLGKEKT